MTRFKPEQYDSILTRYTTDHQVNGETVAGNPNMLVPWYLMASFMYYEMDDPFLTDGCYDWLCKELDSKWDEVEHRHKELIDRSALSAGTGYQFDWKSLPSIIKEAATHLCYKYESLADVGKVEKEACRYCDGSGWFYSTEDLGPCSCAVGKKRATESIEDLL